MPSETTLLVLCDAATVTSQPNILRSRSVAVIVASRPGFFTDAEVAEHGRRRRAGRRRDRSLNSASFVFLL